MSTKRLLDYFRDEHENGAFLPEVLAMAASLTRDLHFQACPIETIPLSDFSAPWDGIPASSALLGGRFLSRRQLAHGTSPAFPTIPDHIRQNALLEDKFLSHLQLGSITRCPDLLMLRAFHTPIIPNTHPFLQPPSQL